MQLSLLQWGLALFSGSLVGFSLGLAGGGGSILAVPLLVYLVGVADPHVAIGTSAVAVAANALGNVVAHARSGHVMWPCALIFAGVGSVGAALGSTLGKMVDGRRLLVLFALLMIVIALLMLRKRRDPTQAFTGLAQGDLPKLIGVALATGTLSGFFGIGGGFLIVPALMLATQMPIINAVGSSLVSVTAFGATTAANYAASGLVDWALALVFIIGGLGGGVAGAHVAELLALRGQTLNIVFAGLVIAVAIYMLVRNLFAA